MTHILWSSFDTIHVREIYQHILQVRDKGRGGLEICPHDQETYKWKVSLVRYDGQSLSLSTTWLNTVEEKTT